LDCFTFAFTFTFTFAFTFTLFVRSTAGRPATVLVILLTVKKTFVTTPMDFPVRLSIVLFVTKVFVADLGSCYDL
jgi:hypothetical protein